MLLHYPYCMAIFQGGKVPLRLESKNCFLYLCICLCLPLSVRRLRLYSGIQTKGGKYIVIT